MAEEITEQKLKDMKPHEYILLIDSSILCLKVVGGWIYWRTVNNLLEFKGGKTTETPCAVAGVFVPER